MEKIKIKSKLVNFLKKIVNFYNGWYAIIDDIIALWLLSFNLPEWLTILILGLAVFETFIWYKNVAKHFMSKRQLFASVKQNNSMCIFGGIGSGKSTMAEFIISNLIPKDKRYYNTNRKGFKAFTYDHLLLKKRLEDGCGVIVDEAGGQADAYHYSSKDNATRKRIDYLNKYFRHWYGDKSLIIYVDQAQGNMNTSLYKNVYYVLQCKGVDIKSSGLILSFIAKIFLKIVNAMTGKKYNNPFCNVCIEYMEFNKLGEYADHYVVNIDDKNHKFLVGSIYEFFTGQNTYVFREFNPANYVKTPYKWGDDKTLDYQIMNDNFNLDEMQKDIQNSFKS